MTRKKKGKEKGNRSDEIALFFPPCFSALFLLIFHPFPFFSLNHEKEDLPCILRKDPLHFTPSVKFRGVSCTISLERTMVKQPGKVGRKPLVARREEVQNRTSNFPNAAITLSSWRSLMTTRQNTGQSIVFLVSCLAQQHT